MNFGLLKKYTRDLKILFVEDDLSFREEFSELLNDIFPLLIDTASDGDEALEKYKNYFETKNAFYDLVISDIQMPNTNGIELTKGLYEINSEQKIVVLSARNEFTYLVELLNLGIEHFFPKPIDYNRFLEELIEICRKVHSLKNRDKEEITFQISDSIYWNKNSKELYKNEELVHLTKTEIILLNKITQDNARLFTIEELYCTFWGSEHHEKATMDNLKNIISRLRKKVPEISIQNLYGMGYKLNTV